MVKRLNITLTQKILLFLLAILLSFYLVTLWINTLATKSIYQEITKSVQSRDAFYIHSLETEMGRITQSLFEFVADKDLIELSISDTTTDRFSWTGKIIAIQNKLKLLQASSSLIKDIKVVMPQIGRTLETKDFLTTVSLQEYKTLSLSANESAVTPIGETLFISMRYPARVVNDREPVFLIAVEIDRTNLARGMKDVVTLEHGNSMLIHLSEDWMVTNDTSDAAQQVLEVVRDSSSKLLEESKVETMNIEGKQHLISYRKMESIDMALIAYVKEESLLGPLNLYKNWTKIILLVSVMVIAIFSVSLYRVIHFPLRKLVRAFRQVEEGNLVTIEVETRRDEFSYLFLRFNNMVSRLEVLIHEVFERDVRNQLSELKSLQSQINPHFLYNCFFILNHLIQEENKERAVRFSGHLGNYFRFITRNDAMEIPLELEIQHAQAYIEIQKICYGEKLDIEFVELEEKYLQLPIARFVIQPLLENAFKYAIEEQTDARGELWIHCEDHSNGISIMVEDNGQQVTDLKLRELELRLLAESANEAGETTALMNIHRRIKLMYGGASGIYVSRSALGGMCVEIRITLEQSEVADHVSNDYSR